jgi:hypothetical protein
MNTGSGGVLNLGSSTSTNARAITLSDNQVKINAPAGNPAITVTDISVNIFTPGTSNPGVSVNASGTRVSQKLIADNVQIGQNPDPAGNNVYIYAQTADGFAAHIRGPYDPSGTLTLGANGTHNSNITLNADGTTTIPNKLTTGHFIAGDALIGDPVAGGTNVYISTNSIRGPGRADGNLVLGANNIATDNITLNADRTTTISTLKSTSALIGPTPSDLNSNFVFINAVSGETVGHIRGPNRHDGSLALGANGNSLSNIVLNADGSTTINGLRDLALTLPLNISNPLPRYYLTDTTTYPVGSPGGINPVWLYLSNDEPLKLISILGNLTTSSRPTNNPPESYSYNDISLLFQRFSLIQVKISFDCYLAQAGFSWAEFFLSPNNGNPTAKFCFITSTVTNPITISFTLQKYVNYDNNTAYLSFIFAKIAPTLSIYFGRADATFFWELTGFV